MDRIEACKTELRDYGRIVGGDAKWLLERINELERENKKLYDLVVENGTEASRERSRVRELLLYLESAEGHDETWSTPKEVLAERVLDAARMFREETNFA